MQSNILKILRCPDCKKKLSERKQILYCNSCNHSIPIVEGIVVFLTQKQLNDFFGHEPLGKYLLTKEMKAVLESGEFIKGLQEIVTFVSTKGFQKKYQKDTCNWNDLDSGDAEQANKRTMEVIADRTRITEAKRILDWPTGKGCFLRTMLDRVKNDAIIVVLDIDFFELASLKVFLERKGKAKNVLFINCDARAMPFRDNSFQAVTGWGGFIEVPDSQKAVAESFRVLKNNGWFAGDGEVYRENSESIKIAERLGIGTLANKKRIEKCLMDLGFRNIFVESVFEGYDKSKPNPDNEQLPAYGDWFGLVVAGGRK